MEPTVIVSEIDEQLVIFEDILADLTRHRTNLDEVIARSREVIRDAAVEAIGAVMCAKLDETNENWSDLNLLCVHKIEFLTQHRLTQVMRRGYTCV